MDKDITEAMLIIMYQDLLDGQAGHVQQRGQGGKAETREYTKTPNLHFLHF